MTIQPYIDQFKSILSEHLEASGKVIYSAASTLSPGDIYFLGVNPGGTPIPDAPLEVIGTSLDALPYKTDNNYLDEAWADQAPGSRPLQKKVQKLFEGLGYDLRSVCSSNLIFIRSRDVESLENLQKLAEDCWPVHELIITTIVKPKVILTYGGAAYTYLFKRHKVVFGEEPDYCVFSSGHGNAKCQWFKTDIKGHVVKVIGVPHLSRFTVSDAAIGKIRNVINTPMNVDCVRL